MKTLKLAGLLIIAFTLSALAQKSDVKISESTVKWTGNKIGGSHNGNIKLKSGYLDFKDDAIRGGKIEMDMNSISNIDLTDAEYNKKLVGHLKSDDFFGVAKFPTATFEISKATKFKDGKATVTGILTIKGKAEIMSFEVVKKGNEYSTQLKVNRAKFDVRYGSTSFFENLGDKAIDDIFILDIKLVL